jgi:hypothetical protein
MLSGGVAMVSIRRGKDVVVLYLFLMGMRVGTNPWSFFIQHKYGRAMQQKMH